MIKPQKYLDELATKDMFCFLEGIETNYETHRPLLLLCLNLMPLYETNVIEFGSGKGSTPYIQQFCQLNGYRFDSYDSDKEWCEKTGAKYIEDWDKADIWHECGLLFIDHRPGEHRKVAILRMLHRATMMVVHDTELNGGGDYGFEPLWPKFKDVLHYNRNGGGAGATAASNVVNLNQFKGLSLGKYKFE